MPLASAETTLRFQERIRQRQRSKRLPDEEKRALIKTLPRLSLPGLALRLGFDVSDLNDARINGMLSRKLELEKTIAEFQGKQYEPSRIAELARRFGLQPCDLKRERTALLLKGIIHGEVFLEGLRKVTSK